MKIFKSMDDCDVQLGNHKENMTVRLQFITWNFTFLLKKKWYSLDKGLRVICISYLHFLGITKWYF